MNSLRQIVKLLLNSPLGNPQIAKITHSSKTTVKRYRDAVTEKALTWEALEGLSDDALDATFNKVSRRQVKKRMPDFSYIHQELGRPGVTLQLLWEEYCLPSPDDAMRYSHFTEHYRRYVGKLKPFMRQPHPPGKACFVDFSGVRPAYTNPDTGEWIAVELFVGTLGMSNLVYATAVARQTAPHWIEAHVAMFAYFDGVTEVVVPDNLKAAITKPGSDFITNESYEEMADRYGVTIIPARIYCPKDKAKVENSVLIVQRWILARLRNRQFFSLEELNQAIAELLKELNSRPFKRLPGNRFSRYDELEKPHMKPLPTTPYEFGEWLAEVKVDNGYHILVRGHWYSVPHTLVGKRVSARITTTTVELFHQRQRVASHIRNDEPGGLSTLPGHQPEAHRAYAERTPEHFQAWAEQMGPNTATLVRAQFDRKLPALGLPACDGLRKLAKQYGSEELEAAATRAVEIRSLTLTSMRSLLRTRRHRAARDQRQPQGQLPMHHNLRGAEYFAQGGGAC